MDIWLIVLVIFVVSLITVVALGLRNARRSPSVDDPPAVEPDYVAERETSRQGAMSEEDRAWQAASQEKDRTNREGTPPPP
jgi:hypothetical protein